jgi:hypothetical protein
VDLGIKNIFDGYVRIEDALEELAELLGINARNGSLMRVLEKRGIVTPELLELYNTLRLARNSIAHGKADLPNEAETQEYIMQAGLLAGMLRVIAAKLRELKNKAPINAGLHCSASDTLATWLLQGGCPSAQIYRLHAGGRSQPAPQG